MSLAPPIARPEVEVGQGPASRLVGDILHLRGPRSEAPMQDFAQAEREGAPTDPYAPAHTKTDQWEGSGPLAGLVIKGEALKAKQGFDPSGHKWLAHPADDGEVYFVMLDGYTQDMMKIGTYQEQSEATAAAWFRQIDAFKTACDRNMINQRFLESDEVIARRRDHNKTVKTMIPWWPTLTLSPYAGEPDGKLHDATSEWPFICGVSDRECIKDFPLKIAARDAAAKKIEAKEHAYVNHVTMTLPVTPEARAKGFDGKVYLIVNLWTRMALIWRVFTMPSTTDAVIATLLGLFEVIAGIILVAFGQYAIGVGLIIAGVSTIVGGWTEYASKINAQAQAVVDTVDPEGLKRRGFDVRGSGPGPAKMHEIIQGKMLSTNPWYIFAGAALVLVVILALAK